MNGTEEAPAGAPLAAHFEAKRRIMATVKQMEERGEKLEEATPEEILEAASKAAETVFKFDFSINGDGQEEDVDARKRNRNRKRNKKRRGKKPQVGPTEDAEREKSEEKPATGRSAAVPVTPAPQRRNAKDKQKKQEVTTKSTAATAKPSSFLKLRKATGTESEVAKMQLRYGQGRRNMAALKQRELRKKAADNEKGAAAAAATSSEFKFNFVATS